MSASELVLGARGDLGRAGVEGSDPASPRPRPREAARGHPFVALLTPTPPLARGLQLLQRPSPRPELGAQVRLPRRRAASGRAPRGPGAAPVSTLRGGGRPQSAAAPPRIACPGAEREKSDCGAGGALPQRAAGSGWVIGAGPGSAPSGGGDGEDPRSPESREP